MAKKNGRPSRYTIKLTNEICAAIAGGDNIHNLCKQDTMPDESTVYAWLRTYPKFSQNYARAREARADAFGEQMLGIAEDARADVIAHEDNPKLAGALVQAAKLKADTLKWNAARMKPKVYGDKLDLTSDGEKIEQPVLMFSMRPVDVKIQKNVEKPEKSAKKPKKSKK